VPQTPFLLGAGKTVQRALGHRQITTTEIHARVVRRFTEASRCRRPKHADEASTTAREKSIWSVTRNWPNAHWVRGRPYVFSPLKLATAWSSDSQV
jgi:hypothetical protein